MMKRDSGRGLTDRKILLAVILGVLGGGLVAILQTRSFSADKDYGSGVSPGIAGLDREDPDYLKQLEKKMRTVEKERDKLKTKYETALRNAEELTAEKEQLTKSHTRALAERDSAARQLKDAGVQTKAGKPGTVKSERTNPTIIADKSVNPQLAEILDRIAINNEVVVAVSNNYIRDMLRTWFENVQRAGVKNYIVVALDDQVAQFCKENNVPYYRRDAAIPNAQKDTGDNHAISGLKFHLLREFLQLGYAVLLSDVDIVFLQNPFDHLVRDSDVESMTDGFDDITAYGWDDVSDDPDMGWARYAHTMRIFVFNSGLFYMRPTVPAIELLDRVTARLAKEKAWDQAVFNEELFFPSHPGYEGLHASKRVLDYYKFMNSKFLFKFLRKDDRINTVKPVTIHVNYHPDKHERMLAIVDKWVHGKADALNRFPDGSE